MSAVEDLLTGRAPSKNLRAMLSRVASLVGFLAIPFSMVACDGPSAASVVQNEPVCPDFEIGAARTKMHGGLKQPLQVKILDGSTLVAQLTLMGLPTGGEATRFLLPDGNDSYTVEWRQCPNERAPDVVGAGSKKGHDATAYTCGKVDPYKTDKLVTKKGEPSTRTVIVPEPPNAACWADDGQAEPAPTMSAAPPGEAPSAAAPPAATASSEPTASAAQSASAAPAPSSTTAAKPATSSGPTPQR